MATPATILAAMREAKAEFYGMFTQMASQMIFGRIFRRIGAAEGFFKITDVFPIGEMEDFQGTATVNGLDSATLTVTTKLRTYTLGIDVNLLAKGDATSKGEVTRQLQKLADRIMGDLDNRFTVLLEANGNDIFGNAFFADAKAIPGSAVSFDNLRSGAWSDSAAEVRASVWEGITALHAMRNSANLRVHDNPEKQQFMFMYHPNVTQFVNDAIFPQLLNDAARLDGIVQPMANPYLTDADDFYMFALDNRYEPFVYGEQEAPNLITTNGQNDTNKILHNNELWQARYEGEVGFGSAFSAVKLIDA